jgi:hypothetical protein
VEPIPGLAPSRIPWPLALLLIALAMSLSVAACRVRPSTAIAPGKLAPDVKSHCANGYARLVGAYKYENNQWGHEKAQGDSEQCLLQRERAGRTEYGWTWYWPGEAPSVYAYPEIIWGWKPWTGGTSTGTRFPRRVADVEHLAIHYAVQTDAVGSYNLAPEVWLTRRKDSSGKPNPELITTEIMFWLDYAGISRPAGEIIDEPTIDGVRYELWKMDGMGNTGGGVGWRIYSFKRADIARAGTLNVHEFLRYMTAHNQIDPSHFVASVEFGNEIVGGRGTTWVERFEIEARP